MQTAKMLRRCRVSLLVALSFSIAAFGAVPAAADWCSSGPDPDRDNDADAGRNSGPGAGILRLTHRQRRQFGLFAHRACARPPYQHQPIAFSQSACAIVNVTSHRATAGIQMPRFDND